MNQQWTQFQPPIAIKHVLFKVTTCLYLKPSSKARSLSTLIAVSVINDTEHKVTFGEYAVKYVSVSYTHLTLPTKRIV